MKKRSRSQTGRGSATGILYNYFLGQVRMHCEEMVAACGKLHRVRSAFRTGRDAYRAHCDSAITSLAQFKEPVLALHSLFRDFLEFPLNSEHYYPLLLSLCQASEQEERLQTLISSYRHVCQTYSPQLVYQKLAIYDAFEQLTECSKEALTRIEHFINETRFLDQKSHYPYDEGISACNRYEDDEFIASRTDPSYDTVTSLQQYWPHSPHHNSHYPQQARKIRACSYMPMQKDDA